MNQRRIVILFAVIALLAAAGAVAQAAMQPAQQDEFVPIDELPLEDQLPAAPLLVAAYAVAWVVVFGYLWSIWQRLGRVERELADVAKRATERHASRASSHG